MFGPAEIFSTQVGAMVAGNECQNNVTQDISGGIAAEAANRPARSHRRRLDVAFAIVLMLPALAVATVFAAEPITPTPADALITKAIAHELASDHGKVHFRFKHIKRTSERTEVSEVVETNDGDVARLLTVNGQPLSPQQQAKEDARLKTLLSDTRKWRAQRERENKEDDDTNKILRAVPDAFLFTYVGSRQSPTGTVAIFSFRPKPSFHAPSRETQILEGMAGTLEIDVSAARIVRLDATLIAGVNFGWGVLGHLDPGGHLLIEQAPVGGGRWDTTHTLVDMKGKILLVKDLEIHEEEFSSDYQPLPELQLGDAVALLQQGQ